MLFKILHGDPSKISLEVTPFHEGWAYVTHDGFFYVDLNVGTKESPNNQRLKLNANEAEKLLGYDIATVLNASDIEIPTSQAIIDYIANELPITVDESGTLQIEGGLASEGCIPYAKAGTAIGIETTSGSKSFTIWGLGEGSTVDADEGTYLVDGIEVFDENGERIYGVEVGDDYSCHVCYTNATTYNSRQRSFYGKVTNIEETEQTSPAGRPLYAITVSPFFGLPADSTFRPFITNEDGTISDEETEYLDSYGVDQERNTFRIPSKPLLGDRILGAYAYATGFVSNANTRGAFTFGVSNIADGNYSGAVGFRNKAAYAALATGNGTNAIGIKSFTQGANTEAYQEAASAMGVRTKVDGFGAHGTGIDVVVNGRGAQGEGISNKISGNAAHGEGEGTVTIGNANHGEGKNTLAGMKWTKIESINDSKYIYKKYEPFSNEYCSGYIDVDAIYTQAVDPYTEEGKYWKKISGYAKLVVEDLGEFEPGQYSLCESIYYDGNSDIGSIYVLAVGEYTITDYIGEAAIGRYEAGTGIYIVPTDGDTYDWLAHIGGTSSSEIVAQDPSFTLTSKVEGFAANDTYSILQTGFDTSYIDAGKITKIDGKTIYVDTLPEFKTEDEKDAVEKTETKTINISLESVINEDGTGSVIAHLSEPLPTSLKILTVVNSSYGDCSGSSSDAHRTIPANVITCEIEKLDASIYVDESGDGTEYVTYPLTKVSGVFEEEEGRPNPDGFNILTDTTATYSYTEKVIVPSVARYFGVRNKPTIGTSSFTHSAHAENNGSDALANYTHSGGQNSIASGTGAFAHGQNAKALSRWTFATNSNTEANAAFAFAEGQDTVAQHQLSHTAGKGTKSKNRRQFVVGQYNDLTGSATELFTVGKGTSDTDRSNAFSVDDKGNAVVAGNVKANSFNGYTINKSVPSDAIFKYSIATTSNNGLMSEEDKMYIEKVKTNLGEHTVAIDVPADAKFKYDVATNTQNGLMPKQFKSAIAVGSGDGSFLNTATGIHAAALGRANQALQKSAFATGINTIAYGVNSLTSGDKNIAFGNNSAAFGSGIQYIDAVSSASNTAIRKAWERGTEYNAAIGVNSEVHGRGNLANADRTFVQGISNRANTINQFVAGKYNDYSSTAAFMIGDGTDKYNRSNAFEVFGKSDSTDAYAKIGDKKVATTEDLENKKFITPITYLDLKELRDNGKLIPGMFYRITDYRCTTTQENTRAMDHKFDIIVQALSEKTLSENASADYHYNEDGSPDGYFCKIEEVAGIVPLFTIIEDETGTSDPEEGYKACDIFISHGYAENADGEVVPVLYKTDIDNYPDDVDPDDVFYYVGTYELDGTVYDRWRKIEIDQEYTWDSDAKKYVLTEVIVNDGIIQWPADASQQIKVANIPAWELKYSLDNDTTRFAWSDEENGAGVIYWMKDEWNNECPYDFKNIQFKRDIDWQNEHASFIEGLGIQVGDVEWFYTFSWINEELYVKDLTLEQNLESDDSYSRHTYSNKMQSYADSAEVSGNLLNNNIIINSYNHDEIFYGCYSNVFGHNCYNNTFGATSYNNTFGHFCFNNTFGYSCWDNTFGNGCRINTFGDGCYHNTFGDDCYHNTFGDDCSYNIFGNYCYHNTFGNYCVYNIVETDCWCIEMLVDRAKNIKICQGVKGTFSKPKVLSPTPDLGTQTIYRAAGTQEIILS